MTIFALFILMPLGIIGTIFALGIFSTPRPTKT